MCLDNTLADDELSTQASCAHAHFKHSVRIPHETTTGLTQLRRPISRHRKVLRPLIHLMPKDIIPHHRYAIWSDFIHGRVRHPIVYSTYNQQCCAAARLLSPFEGDTWSRGCNVALVVISSVSVSTAPAANITWICWTPRLRDAGQLVVNGRAHCFAVHGDGFVIKCNVEFVARVRWIGRLVGCCSSGRCIEGEIERLYARKVGEVRALTSFGY